MIKKIKRQMAVILAVLFIANTNVYADSRVKNIAPTADFDAILRKKVDLVILTDYTGTKLTDLQNKLIAAKTEAAGNRVSLNYTIINSSTAAATQPTTVTNYRYARRAWVKYYREGSIFKSGGEEVDVTGWVTEYGDYESVWQDIPNPLPGFSKSLTWKCEADNHVRQTNYGRDEWTNYYFFDPNNRAATQVTISVTTYSENFTGYLTRYNIYDVSYGIETSWTKTENYQDVVKYPAVNSIDFSKLNNVSLRAGSEKYVLLISDGTDTETLTSSWGNYYAFGNLRRDNVLNFANANSAHVYAVVPGAIRSMNFSDSGYRLSYNSASYKQDLSLAQLIGSVQDGKFYSQGDTVKALNEIIGDNTRPANNKVDLIVATDHTGAKLDSDKAQLDGLKSSLAVNGYDLQYALVDGGSKTAIGTSQCMDAQLFTTQGGILIAKSNGEVWGYGTNIKNSLALGDTSVMVPYYYWQQRTWPALSEPRKSTLISHLASVAGTLDQTVFVKSDGTAWITDESCTMTQLPITNVGKVLAAGTSQFLFLKKDGTLWIRDANGNIGQVPITGIKEIGVGSGEFLVLTNSGAVYYWGSPPYLGSYYGRQSISGLFPLGSDYDTMYDTPYTSPRLVLSGVSDISVSVYTAMAIVNGTAYYIGAGKGLDNANKPNITGTWTSLGIQNAASVSNSGSFMSVLTADGSVYLNNTDNSYGQLCQGNNEDIYDYSSFYKARGLYGIKKVVLNSYGGWAFDANNRIYFWGGNFYYMSGNTSACNLLPVLYPISDYTSYVIYNNAFYTLRPDGSIYATGRINNTNTATPAALTMFDAAKDTVTVYGLDQAAVASKLTGLRPGSDRYFIYVSDGTGLRANTGYGNYFGLGNLTGAFGDTLKNSGLALCMALDPSDYLLMFDAPYINARVQDITVESFAAKTPQGGLYTNLAAVLSRIAGKYKNPFNGGASNVLYAILGEDEIDYNSVYDDFEADPVYAQQWYFDHDPTVFENNTGVAGFAGQWIASPVNVFTKVGKYVVKCRMRDNPKDDNRFDNYRLWSPESPPVTIYFHRRPIADFSYSLRVSGSNCILETVNTSYDWDHLSRTDRGIANSKWKYKLSTDTAWTAGLPTYLARSRVYQLSLEVQDLEGAWSTPAVKNVDTTNLPPVVDCDPKTYDGSGPVSVVVTADDQGENDFNHTNYAWSQSTARPASWSSSSSKVFTTTLSTDGTWYLHMEAFDNAGNSCYVYRGPYKITTLAITGVTLTGYWNHWRGQVDMFGKQLANEPHRFLSLETVKVDVQTTGGADRVVIRFSPELEAMQYTDAKGVTYDYGKDYFGYYVLFPEDSTCSLDSAIKDNHAVWEYTLPLAQSSKSWDDVRLREPYSMTVTAFKGDRSATYTVNDIDITGNVYDLTYIQPVH
ncbi:MAG: hypothetical protein QHH06_06615 [Clostridiales bacterium]|jgi:alpha-tubulin suppressor-like RCC1 family protein|nr:hypothetical protein [Eubacteriales bacterium]MDH7566137.1 hypothetical protein [Clostridiales bacterium]